MKKVLANRNNFTNIVNVSDFNKIVSFFLNKKIYFTIFFFSTSIIIALLQATGKQYTSGERFYKILLPFVKGINKNPIET